MVAARVRDIVIGSRGSSLSRRQTEIVRVRLEARHPNLRLSVKTIKAQADRRPDVPLVALSGEGIFVKELQAALLDGSIDLAVHSLKDLPLDVPSGLRIAAVLEREEARDALVSRTGQWLMQLPEDATVGTSSLRRRSQLLRCRNDLQLLDIRGNVDTRLRKLDEGQYDAVVLAACGLIRLGLEARISEYLDFEQMLPEPGQGALAVEARVDDQEILGLVSSLEDPLSRVCVEAERSFLRALGGGCRVPIAAYASCTQGTIALEGTVVSADGQQALRDHLEGPMTEPLALGQRLADRLIDQGARELLEK